MYPSQCVSHENMLYMFDEQTLSRVHSYDTETGVLKQLVKVRAMADAMSMCIDKKNGDLYVFCLTGKVYVIRREEIADIWKLKESYSPFSACILDDRLFVLTWDDFASYTVREYNTKTHRYVGEPLAMDRNTSFVDPQTIQTNTKRHIIVDNSYSTLRGVKINVFHENGDFLYGVSPIPSNMMMIDDWDRFVFWKFDENVVYTMDPDGENKCEIKTRDMNAKENTAKYVCCFATKRIIVNKKLIVD